MYAYHCNNNTIYRAACNAPHHADSLPINSGLFKSLALASNNSGVVLNPAHSLEPVCEDSMAPSLLVAAAHRSSSSSRKLMPSAGSSPPTLPTELGSPSELLWARQCNLLRSRPLQRCSWCVCPPPCRPRRLFKVFGNVRLLNADSLATETTLCSLPPRSLCLPLVSTNAVAFPKMSVRVAAATNLGVMSSLAPVVRSAACCCGLPGVSNFLSNAFFWGCGGKSNFL